MTKLEYDSVIEQIRTISEKPELEEHLIALQSAFAEMEENQIKGQAELEKVTLQRDKYAEANNYLLLNRTADVTDSTSKEENEEVAEKRTYEDLEELFD